MPSRPGFAAVAIGVSHLPTSLVRELLNLRTFGAVCGELQSAATLMADHGDTPERDEPLPVSDNTNSQSTEFDDLHVLSDDPVDEYLEDLLDEFARDSPAEYEDDHNTDVTPDYSPQTNDEPARPFVGLGENQGRMMQEIRHRMRDMERRLQEKLAKENHRVRSESQERSRTSSRTRYSHSRGHSSHHRKRSISGSRSRSRSSRSSRRTSSKSESSPSRRRTRSRR
ncbi:hypothetical protein PIB30_033896 [Stylosanthes scabra]|uniref:Uncharacterized protein n=1 Tax=Stylosanthes scabra TaxID=79078 RepID=A0ABU6UC27_9FABA|nr:hypothetical protein [Stylosanthes scabra]